MKKEIKKDSMDITVEGLKRHVSRIHAAISRGYLQDDDVALRVLTHASLNYTRMVVAQASMHGAQFASSEGYRSFESFADVEQMVRDYGITWTMDAWPTWLESLHYDLVVATIGHKDREGRHAALWSRVAACIDANSVEEEETELSFSDALLVLVRKGGNLR